MDYFIKEGWMLNPNEKIVKAITKRIELNEGHCPCHNESEDTTCPCTDYREHNTCHCGLYVICKNRRGELD